MRTRSALLVASCVLAASVVTGGALNESVGADKGIPPNHPQLTKFSKVSDIVMDKCMACHSRNYDLPFYANIPGIKEIIEKDFNDGLRAMDLNLELVEAAKDKPIGEATLVCRLLEGEFLDWRRVLPQNQPIKLAVNVAKMTDSIERVGLIISEKLKSPVRCRFGENTADFRSVSTIGEAHDVCQIAGDGQDMEIGFNCRYLLDALRAIPDAECSLELINGLSPIVMNPCDGSERYSYMVLPVRLKAGE